MPDFNGYIVIICSSEIIFSLYQIQKT